jgi:hypothetical protein
MRSLSIVAAALFAFGGAQAAAADWRAVTGGHNVGFVDADSVERGADGRISFSGRFMLGENNPSGDLGYDRYDARVTGDCSGGEEARMQSRRTFFFRGKTVAAPDWIEEDAEADVAAMARELCGGVIGYRSFATLEAAMTEYKDHRSVERLAAYVSDEVELTGTVVQGFEMNGIALCGSEAGCTPRAPVEFCWLEANISVPVPAGADPQSIRRDTADMAFRGRIMRSRTGHGFGHMHALGCQVEATGPARPATIEKRPAVPDPDQNGRSEAAVAAHARMAAAFAGAGKVGLAQDGHSWTVDELKERPTGWQGACGSDMLFGGQSLDPYPTAIMWDNILAMDVADRDLTVRTSRWNGNTEFHLVTPQAADATQALVEKLRSAGVASVTQKGRRVKVKLANGGEWTQTYPSTALAIEAAGIAGALLGREVAAIQRRGNTVSALLAREVKFTFENEQKAREIAGHLENLRGVCKAAPDAVPAS